MTSPSKRRSQLKVLHICQRDDPATGGAVRVAVEYVKRLPNHHVDAHCLFLYGSPGVFQKELGDRAHYLGLQDSRDIFKYLRLPQFISAFQPDVIHHHDGLLWSQIFTFHHPGIQKVAHAHLDANRARAFSKSIIAAWLQRQSTDLLVCITEDTRKSQIQWANYLPKQTAVLYNGVDFNRFYLATPETKINARSQLGLPQEIPVVGFVGRLHCKMKGTDDFLRVFARLPSSVWGLVVGSGPDIKVLKTLAIALGISDRVIFTGNLSNPAVAYHAMTAFCLTSNWEPFGLVVAEAMACGVTVVGFTCEGGVKELLTPETGCIIPNRDVEAMARAVMHRIQHPEDWTEQQANAAKRLAQHHDWDANTLALAQLYRQATYH